MTDSAGITVAETPEFLSVTRKLLTEEDPRAARGLHGSQPAGRRSGPGTGGVRKLRWRLQGRGKRGGARVIYFYSGADIPLFALTAFAKNERQDLSQQDRNHLLGLTKILVETYGRTR